MLTRSFRMNGTNIDPVEAVRNVRETVRDVQPPDPRDLRHALDDVPDKLEQAIDAASVSLRDAGDTLRAAVHDMTAPPQQNRPSTRGMLVGIAFMVAAAAAATWVFRRLTSAPMAPTDADLAGLDREDLDRAAGEGMGTAPGAAERRTSGEGLLTPLDAPRENSGVGLTGVMADPMLPGTAMGLPEHEHPIGVGAAPERHAG
jgi:hypothetical protein